MWQNFWQKLLHEGNLQRIKAQELDGADVIIRLSSSAVQHSNALNDMSASGSID